MHCDELTGRKWRKKYLIVDDYMLDKVLDKIKKTIGIEKFHDTKILIDTDDKLPNNFSLKMFWY